jgi:hypothetical protein
MLREYGVLLKRFLAKMPDQAGFGEGIGERGLAEPSARTSDGLTSQTVDLLVKGNQQGCDNAAFTGPVKQDIAFVCWEFVRGVGSFDVLGDTAGGVAKQEAFDSDRLG